jgi:hypothetical protein
MPDRTASLYRMPAFWHGCIAAREQCLAQAATMAERREHESALARLRTILAAAESGNPFVAEFWLWWWRCRPGS